MELISLQPLWWLLVIPVLLGALWLTLVDAARWKVVTCFLCRAAAVVLLILAICRPFAFSSGQQLHIVYLVDLSQSIDLDAVDDTIETIEESISQLQTNDSWSLFAIGQTARKMETVDELKQLVRNWQQAGTDDRFRSQTQLADCLLQARQTFPAGKVKRMVLFSDGQGTDDDLPDTIRQLDEESIALQFANVPALQESEAAVVELRPSSPRSFFGEVVRLTASVASNQPMDAKLRLVHRGVIVQTADVKLSGDRVDRFQFDVDMTTPGNSKWTVELVAANDYFPVNNQRTCTVVVSGRPRILILHEQEKEMRPLVRALEKQEMQVEVRGEFGLPEDIQGMTAFDAIVLADFPATSMTPSQMSLLNRYVKDFGGGLAMLGSENSFGLGGYHRTPVEEVLPLVSRFEKEKEKPSLAMVLVIDKSGSMSGLPIALARQAAKAAVELLGGRDQIGVVGFDGQPYVISEMRSAGQSDATMADIDTLDAGGGTNLYPAMVVGKEMLENSSAKIRHMICLSDGHTQPADHASLAHAMTDSGITVSTVALGEADRQLLASIADIGRGRYYETNDPANVPQIFTRETMQASKSAIKEDLFGTVQMGDHVALAGFNDADLPFVLGYVMTQPKPTARTLLVAESGDPLLAISRYGLGTGMAYTSDLSEKWGGEWLAWSECGKFWSQMFRAIVRKSDASGIQVVPQLDQDRWDLEIQRFDDDGRPLSRVNWEIVALDDQGVVNPVAIKEIGLGRYRCSIPLGDQESLAVRIRDLDGDKIRMLHYDRPYPKEYLLARQLPDIVQNLPQFDSDQLVDHDQRVPIRRSITPWFGFTALLLLLAGLLLRRI